MTNKIPTSCEACGSIESPAKQQEVHDPNCIKEFTNDHSCFCKPIDIAPIELHLLDFHGRKLYLCTLCHGRETALLKKSELNLHNYQRNVPDQIETRVIKWKKEQLTLEGWQQVYVTERPNWVIENFNSLEEMKEKMYEFIISMEKLEWEVKTRRRAVQDASKELDARLSIEERKALISDPNFKPATNSEFKKISQEREINEAVKTLQIDGATKEQMKAIKGLVKAGIDMKEIRKMMNLEDK